MSEEKKQYYKEIQAYLKLKTKEFDKRKNIEDKRKDIMNKVKDFANAHEDFEKKKMEKEKLDEKAKSGSEKDNNKAVKKAEEVRATENKIAKLT